MRTFEPFAQKAFTDFVGFMNVCVCILGDRLGLFKDLAANGPATSSELAARTGIVERYAREWLSQMACAEYLKYDPADRRFSLPAAHAAILAQEGGPGFMGGVYQNLQSFENGLFTKLLRVFRQGGGIAYSEYNQDFWAGLDRFTIGSLKDALVQQYIPAMPDVKAALERGAVVADVGCGRGGVILMLAEAFPHSRFVGYDAFVPNIDQARANLQAAGLTDRVQYSFLDAAAAFPEQFDLIFSFDALHHATEVLAQLRKIRAALRPGGIFICSEGASADTLEGNIGPQGASMYASSVLVCVPQVLSEGAEALGSAGLHPAKMRELCAQAGFREPRLIPVEGPAGNVFEIRL